MSFRSLILLLLVVFGLVTASKAELSKRAIKTLSISEKVAYPLLGISIKAPVGTELLEGKEGVVPLNYVFPWLRTPNGSVDLAFESSRVSHQSLNDQVTQSLKRLREMGISQLGASNSLNLGGIPMTRVPLEGKHHYPIVRYYFLTSRREMAYLHLHGGSNSQALEQFIRSSLVAEKYPQ